MEKIKITNKCQFEKLVQELEKHPSLARGFRRGIAPTNFKEEWESISTVLNSLGPPIRTGDGWQKVRKLFVLKICCLLLIGQVKNTRFLSKHSSFHY